MTRGNGGRQKLQRLAWWRARWAMVRKWGIVQFIKAPSPLAKSSFFAVSPDEVQFHVIRATSRNNTQDRARDIASAERAWDKACELLRDPAIGLVVLDELNIALKYQYLDLESPR